MKKVTTLFLAFLLIGFASCGADAENENKSNVASPEEKQAIFKQFEGVTQVEVWRKEDGMNSTPIIFTDPVEVKEFYQLIGTKIDKKAGCKYTSGITFVKENGDLFFAEVNISDECQMINYFNEDTEEMEYHSIRPEGLKLLKATLDKIDLPN